MAVCNLFNELTSNSGNFLMFSQYVEDITKNYTNGDNWKVIPTKFVALNIDYNNINIPTNTENLNTDIPTYFQNYFENACAYDRNMNSNEWNPNISKNIFWNCMLGFDNDNKNNLLSIIEENETYHIPEVVYYNDINMHSYNEHQGMGYGEIYCYIPSDAKKIECGLTLLNTNKKIIETNDHLEGFTESLNYKPTYCKEELYKICFEDNFYDNTSNTTSKKELNDTNYNINTIVVLYSIYNKVNNSWNQVYSDIPMGIYFAGLFNNNDLSNKITKYVSTNYDSGTAYGLRICTRFSATSNGRIIDTDIITDDSGYTNICQMMTAMNENLTKMFDVTNSTISASNEYKNSLAIIKNNKTNVPYVKSINGEDFWFVNGKPVTPTKVKSLKGITDEYINSLSYSFKWNN